MPLKYYYHSMYFFLSSLAESPPRDLQITFCSCIIILKPRSSVKMADQFCELSESDLTSLVDQNSDQMIKQ